MERWDRGVYTGCVFFPSSPSHLSSSILERAQLPSVSVHPLCMTNLQCLEQETEDGQRKKDRKKEGLFNGKKERKKYVYLMKL